MYRRIKLIAELKAWRSCVWLSTCTKYTNLNPYDYSNNTSTVHLPGNQLLLLIIYQKKYQLTIHHNRIKIVALLRNMSSSLESHTATVMLINCLCVITSIHRNAKWLIRVFYSYSRYINCQAAWSSSKTSAGSSMGQLWTRSLFEYPC